MAIRNARPITWTPKSLTDALDGTNVFRGAMRTLMNLIPDTTTPGVWACRSPSTLAVNFPNNPNAVVSALRVLGDLAYGMVSSVNFPGKDEPFCFNLATGSFVPMPLTGVADATLPAQWNPIQPPPVMEQVGSRIMVTHPGFPGGLLKFGWLDISGANFDITGDVTAGSRYVLGLPAITAIQPGMTVQTFDGTGTIPLGTSVVHTDQGYFALDFAGTSHMTATIDGLSNGDISNLLSMTGLNIRGPGVQNGTTLVSVSQALNSITLSAPTTSSVNGATFVAYGAARIVDGSGTIGNLTGNTHSNATLDSISPGTQCLAVGQGVAGAGIPPNTTILSVDSITKITMSAAATSTLTTIAVQITGNSITLSQNAAHTRDGYFLNIKGGTRDPITGAILSPLWGAGDTDRNPLVAQPVSVAQFNGRAYFALGLLGIQYSDSGFPCRISNSVGVQALLTSDGLPVTAIASQMLSTLTGGIVQSIIAFQGTSKMQQITGDQTTSDLKMNALPAATGTVAPRSIVNTRLGLAFMSPNGVAFIELNGAVSEIVGDQGKGITAPFQFSDEPELICMAANDGVLRISVSNAAPFSALLSGWQEFWYDFEHKQWSGPHTFPASLIESWRDTFVMVPQGVKGSLWLSSTDAAEGSAPSENGNQMSWIMETVLLPDNQRMSMNNMVEAALGVAFAINPIGIQAVDETGEIIGTLVLQTPDVSGNLGNTNFLQRPLYFGGPVTFKQMILRASAYSENSLRLGNWYLRYQDLGYLRDPLGGNWLLNDSMSAPIIGPNNAPVETG